MSHKKTILLGSSVAIFVFLLLVQTNLDNSYGFLGGDLPSYTILQNESTQLTSGIISVNQHSNDIQKINRYVVFGQGTDNKIRHLAQTLIYSVNSQKGFFSVGIFPENSKYELEKMGYYVIEDFPLDFHSTEANGITSDVSRIGNITGSTLVYENFGYNGTGITIGIVDTGVDFSNDDIRHSLARDIDNKPIMLDADGQGIILTNTTFVANIDENGIVRNYTKPLPENATSNVYKTKKGIFLNVAQGGNATIVQVYNSFYPQSGPAPVFNGTLGDDMKIGNNNQDYIVSKSGVYHLGVIYQGALQGPFSRLQVVPVLVVDSETAGVYDTIIPDLSTSWEDFTRFNLPPGQQPNYDFDFTDETPIKLGSGNEFLIYDFDDDGKFDYSAGTVGAQVLDVFGVTQEKKSKIEKIVQAINGTLLSPLDPNGEYFGIMTDFMGHGTSSAASITSRGLMEYDIYNNTKKSTILGVAPDAKIVPIKALWFGDSVYAWLWAAGFDNEKNSWEFSGTPRVNIISNSWGVSNFPILQHVSGLDIMSLILNVLVTPHSIDPNYPGVTIVSSAGNSGHGYGTMGLPNTSPFGIAVGATTNNVFVGYGPFEKQPRFGNTTYHRNHVVDFSSRGPGIIGDPKPDIMSIGAHGFTPASITKLEKDSNLEPFSLYGGTSMAAPLVSGSAALVMQSMMENGQSPDPFTVKSILMSTATDLQNDPLTQGTGLVNALKAVEFVENQNGIFIVYNDASYENIKNILDIPINSINSSKIGIEEFILPNKKLPMTSWFGGHLVPSERSTTTFTIENPSDVPLEVTITPRTFNLIKQTKFVGETIVQQQDPILNKSGVYAPNYLKLADVKEFNSISDYFDDSYPIPDNASLMSLNVNFDFKNFMNKTDDVYANDLKISSLYLYDWIDKNNDTKISSNELSLVNRAGSWGTVQEMRVSDPNSQFDNEPVVGIYPVPSRYSYWLGETKNNSTSMDYSLSANYYSKDIWNTIWLTSNFLEVPPNSKAKVTSTIIVPQDYQTGVYQGVISFESSSHALNVPVSFVVKQVVDQKDSLVLITGNDKQDPLFGNGYVKGAFDMINRYMAGDWRQYYFEITDPTIDSAAIDVSWEDEDTSFSIFVTDPTGKIIQTNVPSGVFGPFMGWPSNDWLGTTPFSQGGGFYPIKNKDDTSTIIQVPINQTGTYGLLAHSTLFGGNTTTESVTIAAKFTDLEPNVIQKSDTLP